MTDEKFVLAYNTEAEKLERMLREESSRDIRYSVARISSLAKYSQAELMIFHILAEFGTDGFVRKFEVGRSCFHNNKDLAVEYTRRIIEASFIRYQALGNTIYPGT